VGKKLNHPSQFLEIIENQYFISVTIEKEIVGFGSIENENCAINQQLISSEFRKQSLPFYCLYYLVKG